MDTVNISGQSILHVDEHVVIVNISGQSILHVDEHVDIVNISGQSILHVDEHVDTVNISTFIATIYLKGYNKKKLRLVSILAFL